MSVDKAVFLSYAQAKASFLLFSLIASAMPMAHAQAGATSEAQRKFAALNVPFSADRFVQFSAQGDLTVVSAFLDAGMSADSAEPVRSVTPLINAAANGHIRVVQRLLDGNATIDKVDANGCTPLVAAVYYGRVDMMKLLLTKGANARTNPKNCLTPLAAAVVNGKIEIVKTLLSAGADPTAIMFGGQTALVFAAYSGRIDIAKLLLSGRFTQVQLYAAEESARGAGHAAFADMIAEVIRNG